MMTPLLAIGLGFAIGWSAGWLTSRWRHRHARRARRIQDAALREANAAVARAGPVIQGEIARIEDEIAREKARHFAREQERGR